MGKISRIDAAIASAKELSTDWIEAIPITAAKRRASATRILDVCQRLVSARPVQALTYHRIAEEGAVLYSGFPSENYMQNHFRDLVSFWRFAYEKIVDLSAPSSLSSKGDFEVEPKHLRELDAGTRAMVTLLQAHAKNLKRENDRLREIIGVSVDAIEHQSDMQPPLIRTNKLEGRHIETIRNWLSGIKSGRSGLECTIAGARASRQTRPSTLIVPAAVLEAAQLVCGDTSLTNATSEPKSKVTGLE